MVELKIERKSPVVSLGFPLNAQRSTLNEYLLLFHYLAKAP
jgi:hypothetical protein